MKSEEFPELEKLIESSGLFEIAFKYPKNPSKPTGDGYMVVEGLPNTIKIKYNNTVEVDGVPYLWSLMRDFKFIKHTG